MDNLLQKLKRGPAVLFLGQDYLRVESGKDPLLSEIVRKHGSATDALSYDELLKVGAIDTSLAWVQERCDRISIPDWLVTVSSFAWNAVYTSAVDSVWPRAFRSDWRHIQPIYLESYKPSNPRNRQELHCTFLFGNVDREETSERPPLTRVELLKRRPIAIGLAQRIPELVTPMGVLVMEGYVGDRDWFSSEDLLPVVDRLGVGQAHLFGAKSSLMLDPVISELLTSGKLVLHTESLATYLYRASEQGYLRLGDEVEEREDDRQLQIGERVVAIPSELWNQVSKSSIVVYDAMLTPPAQLSDESRFNEFRRFLSESSTVPLWDGYAHGFAFKREFEKRLKGEVLKRLSSSELQGSPLILHGQTGTGKTIALGALACEIRKEGRYPVLFIERKSQRPNIADIDRFCQWAEDSGAPATLVIWDGMIETEQYHSLLQYLVSRGRRVALVGSCYRIREDIISKKWARKSFVEAPALLSVTEIEAFLQVLSTFDPSLAHSVRNKLQTDDNRFLVLLYRHLPLTHSRLRSGVSREVDNAEDRMQQKVHDLSTFSFRTLMAEQLSRAGLISMADIFTSDAANGDSQAHRLQELTGLIMIPGRFGLKVPLELLLRCLGSDSFGDLEQVISSVDIFEWYEDYVGNIEVGPRHAVEARIFRDERFTSAKTEVDYIKQLLLAVKDSPAEVHFAVDLLKGIGPNSDQMGYFGPYFRELSETLERLRTHHGVQNPRMMLQESFLLREAVKKDAPYDAEVQYEKTEKILRQALDIIGAERRDNKLRSILLVELAATLGAEARHILDHTDERSRSIEFFQRARDYLFKARALDPDNYYPVDILGWTTYDILESGVLDPVSRSEVEADILHVFEMAQDHSFDLAGQERFLEHRLRLGRLMGRDDLEQSAFEALGAQGSAAGFYLRALGMMHGNWPISDKLKPDQLLMCRKALSYLEEHSQQIDRDGRCLWLVLRLWWMVRTGKPIFHQERQTVPFTQDEWQNCLSIITKLGQAEERYGGPSLTYLRGLSTFHLVSTRNYSFEIFKELEQESNYLFGRRRVIPSYLASTEDGSPMLFHGTVSRLYGDGSKGEVYVDQLRRNIPFIPRDFHRPDIKKHDALAFHIAFNFIGPIADPKGRQVREHE